MYDYFLCNYLKCFIQFVISVSYVRIFATGGIHFCNHRVGFPPVAGRFSGFLGGGFPSAGGRFPARWWGQFPDRSICGIFPQIPALSARHPADISAAGGWRRPAPCCISGAARRAPAPPGRGIWSFCSGAAFCQLFYRKINEGVSLLVQPLVLL